MHLQTTKAFQLSIVHHLSSHKLSFNVQNPKCPCGLYKLCSVIVMMLTIKALDDFFILD
jgi:hypothetical protein